MDKVDVVHEMVFDDWLLLSSDGKEVLLTTMCNNGLSKLSYEDVDNLVEMLYTMQNNYLNPKKEQP